MISRLLAILMCCQVLFCPALCVDCCASHSVCKHEQSEICDCCSGSESSIPGEQNQPGAPCDPCSDSCNCFCGGAFTPQADEISAVDVIGQVVVPFDVPWQLAPHVSIDCHENRREKFKKLFGRGLLRAYCVLLI
ncbi:MAG: hypothetical protein SFV81_08515 [Pirellulaceae bacterium]|nr:hypothetical protein [Pirellulaceae bacterium]